jgi:hypothetical protein
VLDRDRRQRVVAEDLVGVGVEAHVAAPEVCEVVGQRSISEVAVERLLAGVEIRGVVGWLDRAGLLRVHLSQGARLDEQADKLGDALGRAVEYRGELGPCGVVETEHATVGQRVLGPGDGGAGDEIGQGLPGHGSGVTDQRWGKRNRPPNLRLRRSEAGSW